MPCCNEVSCNVQKAEGGCEVQACVALVREVGILKDLGRALDDAPDENDIVGEDGSPEANGGVDPGKWSA